MAKKRVNKAKKHAARKATSKKAKPHSRVEVVFRRKEFGKAPVEQHFVLHDGRKIESLFQLVDELETMSEETFRSFANEVKNDFANWIRDVFHAPSLADELQRVRNRMEAQRAIMKHLLRDIVTLASKEHHAKIKKEAGPRTNKAVNLVIHEP